ncbi:hypothetical protein [Streptosporangium saharense]|uniref:Uncharacterized protein n=1 Tax=Streptosporangium saharense TaxID=1706840 RepID=A0A7W7QQF9_9ACTN|nr:hypothetical protein [Streptosporangium saharense]MBB4917887.1 hypothetical protein [Streptosporangium saharense]
MTVEWAREEAFAALRGCLLRVGALTDGACIVDVVAEPYGMLVVFRWKKDPNTYAVEIAFPAGRVASVIGEPVTSPDEWAADVGYRLAEDLVTGLVRRGRRTVRDGYVVLDDRGAPDIGPEGFSVSEVPLVTLEPRWRRERGIRFTRRLTVVPVTLSEAGSWLAEAGMDVTVPRRLVAEGRLVCWLQARADGEGEEPAVGQAVASWEDTRHAVVRLELIHVQPGIPEEMRAALVRVVVHEAAEVGALRVVTDVPGLHELGFRPVDGGGSVLSTIVVEREP